MFGYRFVRSAAVALGLYGVLGVCVAAAMLVVGFATFDQLASVQKTLQTERSAVIQSLRTVSGGVRNTATATSDAQKSLESARAAADQASKLANDSAGTFREVGTSLTSLTFLGIQPLIGVGPQFDQSADQLQQLAISLGATREALAQNGSDVQRVGGDLTQLQAQLDSLATSLSQPAELGPSARALLPLQVAFFGLCALVFLQSVMSIAASIVLFRLQRVMGTTPLLQPPFTRRAPSGQPPSETGTERVSAAL